MKIEFIILLVLLLLVGLFMEERRYALENSDASGGSGDSWYSKKPKIPENKLKKKYVDTCCIDTHQDGVVCLLDGDCYIPLRDWLDKGLVELFSDSHQLSLQGRVYRYVNFSKVNSRE